MSLKSSYTHSTFKSIFSKSVLVKNEEKIIRDVITDSISLKQKLLEKSSNMLFEISKSISKTLSEGGTIFFCGNGGSAADAQHVAAEFVGKFNRERRPLPAESLTTNTSVITAIANDYDFSEVFSRQIIARVKPKDIVVGISTSGKSKNVLNGLQEAQKLGAITIGFTGNNNNMDNFTDYCLKISSDKTPRIQETHILAWHIICDLVEAKLFDNKEDQN